MYLPKFFFRRAIWGTGNPAAHSLLLRATSRAKSLRTFHGAPKVAAADRMRLCTSAFDVSEEFAMDAIKSQELLPKYIEQGAKQGPSSQFAEPAGSGLNCSSSKELRGLGVRAHVCV